eukprot:TRINITY_DN8318_c0_g1_i2.p1 TRINITY_DN8318_c0_g1~~TRINITY_DN8318_c0_g1_i2.p1  ORF type:complete len:803 (-),score=123.24 TRINITY_DN8318_c0_g1_i2:490-2862(-)
MVGKNKWLRYNVVSRPVHLFTVICVIALGPQEGSGSFESTTAFSAVETLHRFSSPSRELPTLTFEKLWALSLQTRRDLARAFRTEGALFLTGTPGLDDAASHALKSVGNCFAFGRPGHNAGDVHQHDNDIVRRNLFGGIERLTLATSTKAGIRQPLPVWAAGNEGPCGGLANSSDRLRDLTGSVLSLVSRSLDSVAKANAGVAGDEAGRDSLESIVESGTLLEHFHVYSPLHGDTAISDFPTALKMHTDAGMLQALLVRWRFANNSVSTKGSSVSGGLEVQLSDGSVAVFDSPTLTGAGSSSGVLLLVGQGTQDWLPHLGLRAAPHSLSAWGSGGIHGSAGDSFGNLQRLVYGVMVLPPDDFRLPGNGPTTGVTGPRISFGDWWQRARQAIKLEGSENLFAENLTNESVGTFDAISVGCLSTTHLSRRLQDQALACSAGELYCWMQCQTVPASLECATERAVCLSGTTGDLCEGHDGSCAPGCPAQDDLVLEVSVAGERNSSAGSNVNGLYRASGKHAGKWLYVSGNLATIDVPRTAEIMWDENYMQWSLHIKGYQGGKVLYANDENSQVPPANGWRAVHGKEPSPVMSYFRSVGRGDTSIMQRHTSAQQDGGFCSGVLTDMHMMGFTWAGTKDSPCLVYLFSGLDLTTAVRFVFAVVGTVGLGVLAEFLVSVRRRDGECCPSRRTRSKDVASKGFGCCPASSSEDIPMNHGVVGERVSFSGRSERNVRRLMLYAFTRTLGYGVMLLTMTYSGELFLAVIFGLTLGHALFNLEDDDGTISVNADVSHKTA